MLATFAKSSFLIMDTASEIVGLELVDVAPLSPPAVASFCSMGFDQTCSVFSPGLGCPSSWFEAISGYLCGAIGVMNRAHSQKVVLLTWADPMTLPKALQARRLPVWPVRQGVALLRGKSIKLIVGRYRVAKTRFDAPHVSPQMKCTNLDQVFWPALALPLPKFPQSLRFYGVHC